MDYHNEIMVFYESGLLRCAHCGERVERQERFYERDGIPYCRHCLLGESGRELIRICEKTEGAFFRELGFVSHGRLPDGSI